MPPNNRENCFDLLRLLFAIAVLFTHAYFIAGVADRDFLSRLSHNVYHYPHIAVPGFFIISGYLVIQSLQRSASVQDYLVRRFARIYPGLLVMLLLTLLLGWIVYTGSVRQYFLNRDIYVYFLKNLLMLHQYVLPGFFEGNPANDIVNVSIWSIPYEVIFYLLLAVFFALPTQRKLAFAMGTYFILWANLVLMHYHIGLSDIGFENITILNLSRYGSFFFGGVVAGLVPGFIKRNRLILLIVSTVALTVLLRSSLPPYLLNVLLPVFILSLGQFKLPGWSNSVLRKTGDPSYGIYIYGFPVQQALYYFLKPGYWQLAFLSVGVLSIIGICSWKLIERPALSFFTKRLMMKRSVQNNCQKEVT